MKAAEGRPSLQETTLVTSATQPGGRKKTSVKSVK